MRRLSGASTINIAGLVATVVLVLGCSPAATDDGEPITTVTLDPGALTTIAAVTTTTTTTVAPTTTTTTTVVLEPPEPNPRYVVPEGEVEREAKQLAADIAYALTTYEESDSPEARLLDIAGEEGLSLLTGVSEPLTLEGRWSRGEIVYPQMGGLRNDRASVMVVTRQTVGSGPATEFSIIRTLDVRVKLGESGWEFDELASAGGVFDTLGDLILAHEVAADSRIEMPEIRSTNFTEPAFSAMIGSV